LISYLHEPGERRFSLSLDLAEIFKPIFSDRIIFTILNRQQITEKDFMTEVNCCYLNEKGRKTIIKEYDEKLKTIINHKKLERQVSYRYLVRLECYKLVKHLIGEQEYEGFKIWW
ncbi:MAG: CRISPR-associated endonuclease Cas1, partial [Bacteroidota bacterium]